MEATSKPGISLRAVWEDLISLTKARLSILVVFTSIFGYLVAAKYHDGFSWATLFHTTLGTLMAAFGSAVFNQIMEVDSDSLMPRTAERPLPSNRIPRSGAFVLGWLFSAFGIVHLAMMTNFSAGAFAAATLFVYLFIYTPLKRKSSFNTVVGAIAGALPPLIGWTAGGGSPLDRGGLFLFALLFFWQLPHFAAINWMYREDYIKGGFVMWSNRDENGSKTARLALIYSACLVLLGFLAAAFDVLNWIAAIPLAAAGAFMCFLAWKFLRSSERKDARNLFFFTLLYLPFVMLCGYLGWITTHG